MAGLRGLIRLPGQTPRDRRNSMGLANHLQFIAGASSVEASGGILSTNLATSGGLETVSGELRINLDTNPGLVLGAGGIKILKPASSGLTVGATGILIDLDTNPGLILGTGGIKVRTPASSGLTIGSTGIVIDLDTNPGLVLGAGGIKVLTPASSGLTLGATGLLVDLDTNPGLVLGANGIKIQLDGATLTLGGSGLSVTAPEGAWTVTAVKVAAYTAAVQECVRCDPGGGAFQVDLPTAVGATGRRIWIKNVANSVTAITIAASGAETIDGAASVAITTAYGSVRVTSDGAGWMVE